MPPKAKSSQSKSKQPQIVHNNAEHPPSRIRKNPRNALSSQKQESAMQEKQKKQDEKEIFDEEDNNEIQEEEGEGQAGPRENTLSRLTKKLINFMKSKPGCIMDINEATQFFGVQKRRIYDITNVLEGIGYVEKLHKNQMRWVGGTTDQELNKEMSGLESQLKVWENRNRELDTQLGILSAKFKKEFQKKLYLNHLTLDDFHQVMSNLDGKPDTLLIVSTTEGAVLETHFDPITQKNQILVDGGKGMNVYVCRKETQQPQQSQFQIKEIERN